MTKPDLPQDTLATIREMLERATSEQIRRLVADIKGTDLKGPEPQQ